MADPHRVAGQTLPKPNPLANCIGDLAERQCRLDSHPNLFTWRRPCGTKHRHLRPSVCICVHLWLPLLFPYRLTGSPGLKTMSDILARRHDGKMRTGDCRRHGVPHADPPADAVSFPEGWRLLIFGEDSDCGVSGNPQPRIPPLALRALSYTLFSHARSTNHQTGRSADQLLLRA